MIEARLPSFALEHRSLESRVFSSLESPRDNSIAEIPNIIGLWPLQRFFFVFVSFRIYNFFAKMADPENQGSTAQSDPAPEGKSGSGGSGGDIGLSMAYIMSIPGILKIVEFVCIFLLQNKASSPPPPEFLLVVLIRNVGGDWRDEFVYVSSVATATSTLHQGLLF